MFDPEIRIAFAQDRFDQLQRDMQPSPRRTRRRARRALGELMIAFGDRLAREPAAPCREVSSRA